MNAIGGHTFCKSCIQGLVRSAMAMQQQQQRPQQQQQKGPHCPLCRLEFTPAEVSPNRALFFEMRLARVQCPNRQCGATFSPLESKVHQDECPYGITTCPHQPHGCPFKAIKKDIRAHVSLCPYEQIKGLFPKIRQANDHVTAAMRGWENAFVSQQQMMASHTAMLRVLDRRSHHNPMHHLQVRLFCKYYH